MSFTANPSHRVHNIQRSCFCPKISNLGTVDSAFIVLRLSLATPLASSLACRRPPPAPWSIPVPARATVSAYHPSDITHPLGTVPVRKLQPWASPPRPISHHPLLWPMAHQHRLPRSYPPLPVQWWMQGVPLMSRILFHRFPRVHTGLHCCPPLVRFQHLRRPGP